MNKPLALILYEQLLPGSQLVNRLQDLGYRVQAVLEPGALVSKAAAETPMIVLADLRNNKGDIPQVIRELKANPQTRHIPVLAFAGRDERLQLAASRCGANLVAVEDAVLSQLPQLLDQALAVE